VNVIACVHQKGGTGKTTLAISVALTLAQQKQRVLLLDTDYQGTASDWGQQFGQIFNIEVHSQVQANTQFEQEVKRFQTHFNWCVIDTAPTLSDITVRILQTSHELLIPIRPALPDIWAISRLAALIKQTHRAVGYLPQTKIVFNQYQGENLSPLQTALTPYHLPVSSTLLPLDSRFVALFAGQPLSLSLRRLVQNLLTERISTELVNT
jgi:chromosome partitioning protein